jgi:hypothetical protein
MRSSHGVADVATLLEEVEAGRGARDCIVIPVPDPSADAVPQVRSTVRDVVAHALRPADPAELELLCSELVSNAVVHGEAPVWMVLHEAPAEIVVAVFDRGGGRPEPDASPTGGLRIVDALSRGRWGCVPGNGGKWVWAALPRRQ